MSCYCYGQLGSNNCTSNPCAVTATNTAACESLPSALDNFITQFFGALTKTEVDGEVTWELPCDLEIGLESNPRYSTEGLACYFLRLFEEGITGRTGPTGPAGKAGTNGANAFTVTLSGFTQPTLSEPTITVRTYYNPAILTDGIVFIQTSGWYQVVSTASDGTIMVTLLEAVPGAGGVIAAGKIVIPTGPRGLSTTGPQGPQGIQGPAGAAGESHTETNGLVQGVGVNFALGVVHARVLFGTVEPEVTLPDIGTYLVTVVAGIQMAVGAANYPNPETVELRLYNASLGAVVANSTSTIESLGPNELGQIVIHTIINTASTNNTIQLYGLVSTGATAAVVPAQTRMTYVKLAA